MSINMRYAFLIFTALLICTSPALAKKRTVDGLFVKAFDNQDEQLYFCMSVAKAFEFNQDYLKHEDKAVSKHAKELHVKWAAEVQKRKKEDLKTFADNINFSPKLMDRMAFHERRGRIVNELIACEEILEK